MCQTKRDWGGGVEKCVRQNVIVGGFRTVSDKT